MFTQFNLQELTALGDFFCYHFVLLAHLECDAANRREFGGILEQFGEDDMNHTRVGFNCLISWQCTLTFERHCLRHDRTDRICGLIDDSRNDTRLRWRQFRTALKVGDTSFS